MEYFKYIGGDMDALNTDRQMTKIQRIHRHEPETGTKSSKMYSRQDRGHDRRQRNWNCEPRRSEIDMDNDRLCVVYI